MAKALWLLAACGLSFSLGATGLETPTVRSVSGQFIAQSYRPGSGWTPLAEAGTNAYVALEPTLLPVSCERVKLIICRELALNTPWRGKVFLSLYPPQGPDDTVLVHAQWFRDHWDYQLRIPAVVERARLVRALTSVVLLEIANRRAGDRSTELPAWLVEGVTAQILAAHEHEIVLTLPQRSTRPVTVNPLQVTTRQQNRLERVKKELSERGALSFDEMSWPTPAQLAGLDGGVYQASAQLFVNRLMLLPGGRESLGAMVAMLPDNLNWQFALLRAFSRHFNSLLEVEKWWSLQVVNFTGRDLSQTWPPAESWLKVNQALRCRVQIRSATNALPSEGEIPLQTIVRDWAPETQVLALQSKLQELELVRMRVVTNCLPVVDGYLGALRNHLESFQRGGLLPFRKAAYRRQATEETIRRLDALDRERPVVPAPEPGSPPTGASALLQRNPGP